MVIEKIKILEAVLELPAKQYCQSSPPRILIFSFAMGADFSFYVKSIATYAPAFSVYNNSVLARVSPLLRF